MTELEVKLREASAAPKSSAVRFVIEHNDALCDEHKITRQPLRRMAELIDKQTKQGMVFKLPKKVAVSVKEKVVEEKAPKVIKKEVKPKAVKPKKKGTKKKLTKKS